MYGWKSRIEGEIAECYLSVIIRYNFLIFGSVKCGRIEVCRFMNVLQPKDADLTAMSGIVFKVGGVFVWKSGES